LKIPDFRKDQGPLPDYVKNAQVVSVSRYDEDPAMNRLQILARHFLGYFAISVISAVLSLSQTPPHFGFVWFVVGWSAPLALHVAYVMELFGPHKVRVESPNTQSDDNNSSPR